MSRSFPLHSTQALHDKIHIGSGRLRLEGALDIPANAGGLVLFAHGSGSSDADEPVVPLNEQAYAQLGGVKRLEIVPGATHLFEEPGTLDLVAELAARWFGEYLSRDWNT